MATKKKTVSKNRLPKQKAKSANVTLMNQGKRVYQTEPENVINGGEIAEYSQGRKLISIRPGERCTVKRAYAELMAKNYPNEILLLE